MVERTEARGALLSVWVFDVVVFGFRGYLQGLFVQVGDDGSVLPATEDEVFQSLVSGSGNGLSSFRPDGSDAGEDDEEDEEEEEEDEGNEFDSDDDDQAQRNHNSKIPKLSFIECMYFFGSS